MSMDILNLPVAAEGPVTEDTAILSYRKKRWERKGMRKNMNRELEREREGLWM